MRTDERGLLDDQVIHDRGRAAEYDATTTHSGDPIASHGDASIHVEGPFSWAIAIR